MKTIDFMGRCLNCRVCDDEASRQKGLMGVTSLPQDEGAFFDMGASGPVGFWMKDTLVPLDIVALDEDAVVLKVGKMEPHTGKFTCDGPVRYVVEANSGWFEGLVPGMRLTMRDENLFEEAVRQVLQDTWSRPTSFGDIVYRPFSEAFYMTIREMKLRSRSLNESSQFDELHLEILSTDIGEFGLYEGVRVPLDIPIPEEFHAEMFPSLHEATKKLPPNTKLNQPKRSGGGTKYHVYVRDPRTGNIKRVGFGAKGMGVGIHDPKRVKSFVARHKCSTRNDKTTASYWSCRLPRYWKSLGLKKTSSKWW